MSDQGPGAAIVGIDILDMGAAALEEVFSIEDLAAQIDAIDSSGSIEEAMLAIDSAQSDLVTVDRTPAGAWKIGVLTAVQTAITAHIIAPHETKAALAWVAQHLGKTHWSVVFVAAGGLLKAIAEYARRTPAKRPAPARHAAAGKAAPITLGPETMGNRTAGGRMVNAAERGLVAREITAPGLTAAEADAISLAIGASYGDTMGVVIDVVNALTAEIDRLGAELGRGVGGVKSTTSTTSKLLAQIEATQRLTTTRIANLEKAIGVALSRADAAEKLAKRVEPAPKAPNLTGIDRQVSTLAGKVSTIEKTIPTLATVPALATVAAGVTHLEATGTATAPVTQISDVPNLPTDLKTLQDCCYANSAVTKPIKAGGATSSLLRQLGGILTKGYAILAVAGMVDAVIAVFDMPAVVIGTIRGAEWVMPIAEDAAHAAMSDISWGDTVAGIAGP